MSAMLHSIYAIHSILHPYIVTAIDARMPALLSKHEESTKALG